MRHSDQKLEQGLALQELEQGWALMEQRILEAFEQLFGALNDRLGALEMKQSRKNEQLAMIEKRLSRIENRIGPPKQQA